MMILEKRGKLIAGGRPGMLSYPPVLDSSICDLSTSFFVCFFPMFNGKAIKSTGERAKYEVRRRTMTEERWDQCYVIQTFCQYREPPIRGARFSIDRISRLHFARGISMFLRVSSLYVHCEQSRRLNPTDTDLRQESERFLLGESIFFV